MFFFHRKFKKFLKIDLSVQVNESLGRLIVLWTTIEFYEDELSFSDLHTMWGV